MMKRDAKQQKRYETYAKKLGLTVEDTDALCRAADDTWQYIGYDCLTCGGDREMKRAEVIEVVMDADHIVSNNRNLPEPVRILLRSYTQSDTIRKLLKEFVFVYANYGM